MKKKNIIKVCLASSVLTLMMSTLVNADTVGTVTASSLNVRQEPSTSSSVVDKAYYGDKVSILSKEGNWYKIRLSTEETAYVSSNFVKQSTLAVAHETPVAISAKVTVPILNFRSTPEIAGNNIVGKLTKSENVVILSSEGEWSCISTSSKQVGYVFTTYLQIITSSEASSNKTSVTDDIRSQVVAYAKQFLGNPYVFGGTNLTSGIDCSSFTQQILRKFGYSISRTSYAQIQDGTPVTYSDLLPGDLVFYGFNRIVSHVAIYIGDGKIIHASGSKTGVIISGVFSQGRKPAIGAVRVIQQ